tara:strand:- start:240 stop:563 length:324 start_codon:yes stop_codon:yes gene_type:complete
MVIQSKIVKSYSISRKLQQEKKSSDEFEVMLNQLTLEELIALKLELAAKAIKGKIHGIPLWKKMPEIAKDAVFKYAVSTTKTKAEAARFLGLNISTFNQLSKRYHIE